MSFYLETSALVKLVVAEPEASAMRSWALSSTTVLVTSDLSRTELIRAVRRHDATLATTARSVLDVLTILALPRGSFERAAHLDPLQLRSLDALHLASALELGDDLEGIITYDDRLAAAAAEYGIPVLAPA